MKSIPALFFFILNFYPGFSQKSGNQSIPPDSNISNACYEKVYLHTDRSFYFAGDDIWFKAYMVDAFTNKLLNNSNILYVELISPDFKIVQKRTVQMSQGMGNGDFHINDNILPGQYQLRAYTNWMRNSGDNFFFRKIILIESGIKNEIPGKETLQKESPIDIQFFPEGGSLVDDIQISVGFKSIDSHGNGCDVAGDIISSEGDTITKFESTHLGMGKFYFTPQKGISYFATGKSKEGLEFKAKLPVSFTRGIVLSEGLVVNDRLFLNINTNTESLPSVLDKTFKLEIRSHRIFCIAATLKISSLKNSFSISVKDVPEGIASMTISENDGKPLCERLIYIRNQPGINFSLISDKKEYTRRSPVSLNISVTDSLGKSMLSSLSLSATNADIGENIDLYQSDIASYFLLESEIKGSIEQPGYYFDPLNSERFMDLDLLLLTQGWRDFKWKYIPDSIRTEYPVEFGFPVYGRLTKRLFNTPLSNANISLILISGNGYYYYSTVKTSSSGHFAFNNLQFPGKSTMIISSSDGNYNPKGFLTLDSLIRIPPDIDNLFTTSLKVAPEVKSDLKKEAVTTSLIKKKYTLNDTIELGEVVVTAKKPVEPENSSPQIYNLPDYTLKIDDKTPFFSNIFQLMEGQFPGVIISGTPPNIQVSVRGRASFSGSTQPLFLLDGTPVEVDIISSISISEVDRIDLLKTPGPLAVFGMRGANGVISVITKRGVSRPYIPVPYSINKTIFGYDIQRTFYSPEYDTPNSEGQIPDLRTTLYWDPNILTRNDSATKVKYFNGDKASKVVIKAEGMTLDGIPITAKASYIIDPGF